MHLLILLALTSAAETFNGEVVKVQDGDSIVVNRDDGQIEIRLRDIDCPEADPSVRSAILDLLADESNFNREE